MKHVGIIGAGAMGTLFAYLLHNNGFTVSLYEKDKTVVDACKKGISITPADSDIHTTFTIAIASDPAVLKDCDMLFFFIKSYTTSVAVDDVKDQLKRDAVIVSLQNGLGNYEALTAVFNRNRVVYGTTAAGATKAGLSSVKIAGLGETVIGGSDHLAVSAVAGVLSSAGLAVAISDSPQSAVWEKVIINSGINPLGALLGITNINIIENKYSAQLQKYIIYESVAVARSLGIEFNQDAMLRKTQNVCKKTACNHCSMLQDIKNKRKTEIDTINGMIITYAKQKSIKTPYNETVYNLVKALEPFSE